MIDVRQFRHVVVDYTLNGIGLYSEAASNLLVGTALVESGLRHLSQINGPAIGLFQIEPATAWDIRRYLIERNIPLGDKIGKWVGYSVFRHCEDRTFLYRRLADDIALGCAFARVRYAMVPEPLPDASDIDALGQYWKEHYNSPLGKGEPVKFATYYREAHKAFTNHKQQAGA